MLGKPAVDLGVRDVCRCGIRPWLQTAVAFWARTATTGKRPTGVIKYRPRFFFERESLVVCDGEPMSKVLVIAIIACLVSTLADARPYRHRRAQAQPRPQIACTVLGCNPVPVGCVPRAGRTWSGLPSGFDVIVCPPGGRPPR
jgi:hypothetical protein